MPSRRSPTMRPCPRCPPGRRTSRCSSGCTRCSALVAMAVDAVRAGRRALILEAAQLLDVASLGRDEAAPAGQCLGLVEDLALLRVADRDLARPPTLGPGVLERQPVATVGPLRADLERLAASQSEGGLQPQRHCRVRIGDPGKLATGQLPRLADIGDVLPVADAVVVVVAAVAVAPAQLLQLVVQVAHSVAAVGCLPRSCRLPLRRGASLSLVCRRSGQCFCPSRTPGRCGNHEGHGTPLPFRAELLLAAAARGIGVDGASCAKTIHRVSHCPKALGVPVGAMADMARGERTGADRVARSEVLTRLGARHVGSSLATAPAKRSCAGAACASSLLARAA